MAARHCRHGTATHGRHGTGSLDTHGRHGTGSLDTHGRHGTGTFVTHGRHGTGTFVTHGTSITASFELQRQKNKVSVSTPRSNCKGFTASNLHYDAFVPRGNTRNKNQCENEFIYSPMLAQNSLLTSRFIPRTCA
jgi:hypothetical protein